MVLYVKRWLEAPVQLTDGTLQKRGRGTPQGSAVSRVLANLFLHYAFDAWMAREFPGVAFERYVDDAVVHCVGEAQAQTVVAAIAKRMEQVAAAPAHRPYSKTSHGVSIRSLQGGCSITGRFTAPRCLRLCNASTPT